MSLKTATVWLNQEMGSASLVCSAARSKGLFHNQYKSHFVAACRYGMCGK